MSNPNPSSSNQETGAAPATHLLTPSPSSPAGTPTSFGSNVPTPHGQNAPPVPVPATVAHPRQPSSAPPVGLTYTGRRTHKKSRTGCAICKARKIKCDERHPSCLNCISHGVECPFLTAPPGTTTPVTLGIPHRGVRHATKTATRASRSPSSPLSPYPYPPQAPPVESDILPLLELELLHNFTSRTYHTLASDPAVRDFWRVAVVDAALKCDYIMRAVLAISSLHLAYHQDSSERRDFYTAQGMMLHQKASREAMKYLSEDGHNNLLQVDKDAAARLFLFSMLTIYFALASPRRPQSDGSFFINETSSFPEWTFLVTGAKSLSRVLGERGHETMLAPFLAYGGQRWRTHRAKMQESQTGEAWGPLSTLRQNILGSMQKQEGQEGAQERLSTYIHALDELELSLVIITREQNGEGAEEEKDVLDAMLWLWEVSDSLVPLLKIPTPEAVAIFAHFCILWKHHERTWWLQGWGDHLVERAHEILDEEHRGWIEWPMRVVGLGLGR
ncbi:putative transcription factor [Cercophora samala]|uniref:Transcription factor n=1 Tax=Cercophora samala TaxID=330535 RepID=A0AA40DFC7_9PEZI|nr:putative transcription factor [Cercophora samala]